MVEPEVELSIVIPSYQRKGPLLRLLRSVADALVETDPVEIVVVLDGSTDGSKEALASLDLGLGPRLRWSWQPNVGPAGARNAGLAASQARTCLLVDDDMTIERPSIEYHLDFHRSSARPTILLGPHWEPAPEPGRPSAGLRSFVAARNARLEAVGDLTDPFDFWTGVMSAPRHTLVEIGGFDEGFHGWGEEDVELGFRLIEAGVPIRFEAGAGARHHRDRRPGQAIVGQRQRGRNLVRLCQLHPQAVDRVELAASAIVSAFELGVTSPRIYGAVAETTRLALQLGPIRTSRFRQPLFRLGSDAALLAGALERDAPERLLRRLTVRDRSFAADVRPPSAVADRSLRPVGRWATPATAVAATTGDVPSAIGAEYGSTGDDPSAIRAEYESTGIVRACRPLADPAAVPRLVADAPRFATEVADLGRRGERRVPYRFTPAIEALAIDAAIVGAVEAILGSDRWVAWGPNIQIGTPNAAHEWHTDIESDLWPTITVAVGLDGCTATNATRYIPGTNRFSSTPLSLSDPTDDQLVLATARRLDPACDAIVRFDDFADGRFYLFDGRGWHCGDTEASTDRLSLFLHYQLADEFRIPAMSDYRRGRWFDQAAPFRPNPAIGGDYERRVHRPPAPPRVWHGRRLRPAVKRVRRRLVALGRRARSAI